MAKKTKRGGKAWKAGYSAYKAENRVYKNAVSRLERHIKNYPEDSQAVAQLETFKKEGRPWKRTPPRGKRMSPREIKLREYNAIKVQTPVINRKGPEPEWKQTLRLAFNLT